MTFIVLSWNILSQFTIEEQKVELGWSKRLPKILLLLKTLDADIVLLQEVDLANFEVDFASLLPHYDYARHKIIVSGKHKRTNLFGNVTLWKRSFYCKETILTSRCLHVMLEIAEKNLLISNVHFPAKNGLEGYREKFQHLVSCMKVWKDHPLVLFGGDFNDGLSFQNEKGDIIGLGKDVKDLGFLVPPEELKKKTCHHVNGNLYNVDHVLCRGLHGTYVNNNMYYEFDAANVPNPDIPSDHIPILYKVCFVSLASKAC
jgi:endonuclease/exonuclease/phosphatase family metal-dependent hydrolase